jgi:hypothetical protein
MATTQEKTTPCCIKNDTTTTTTAASPPQKPSNDWANPSEDPTRKRSSVATMIPSFEPLTDTAPPPPTATTASTKGSKFLKIKQAQIYKVFIFRIA